MKSNNLFTYILYALLGGLVIAAVYLIVERQKANKLREAEAQREEAELQQTLREMGYIDGDTTAAGAGSRYMGDSVTVAANNKPAAGKPLADKNGIEDETSSAQKSTAQKSTKPSATAPQNGAAKPIAPSQPVTTAPKKNLSAKGGTTSSLAKKAPALSSGRYKVVAGSFTHKENARTRMEELVKTGFQDAEVVSEGAYFKVIAKRTNSLVEAERIEGELERRGIDTMVYDMNKKK